MAIHNGQIFSNNTEYDPSLPQFCTKSSLFNLMMTSDKRCVRVCVCDDHEIDAECERKAIKLLPINTFNSRIVLFS